MMEQVKSFTIGNATYNAGRASAVNQDKLLSLITGSVMERALSMQALGGVVDDAVLVPMFMGMDQGYKSQITTLIMGAIVINGTTQRVSVADFDGRMVEYNTLLSQLLQWNLADFFTWLSSVLSGAAQAQQASQVL